MSNNMSKSLETMTQIQNRKAAEIGRDGVPALTPEGKALAEHCKFTIDNPPALVAKKADPKR